MESIGGKLKATREEKGYSLEQVARETHIAKRFLESMEAEDFSAFPGEPYLIGFLRTYAAYLSLDPQEMVSLYRNLKLQEQPAPIDELLDKRSRKPISAGAVIGVTAAVVVIAVVVLFLTGVIQFGEGREQAAVPAATEEPPEGESITLVDEILERPFSVGDAILIPLRDESYPLSLDDLNGGLILGVPGGAVELEPGEEKLIDVDEDGRHDVKVLLRSVNEDAEPTSVVLRLDRVVQAPSGAADGAVVAAVEVEPVSEPVGSTNVSARERRTAVIGEFEEREARFLELEFRGYSLLRYRIDGGDQVERYFQSGDTLRTSFRTRVSLGMSNAGAIRARVAGRDIDLGDPGEVAVWRIAWAENGAAGPYRLELIPMY